VFLDSTIVSRIRLAHIAHITEWIRNTVIHYGKEKGKGESMRNPEIFIEVSAYGSVRTVEIVADAPVAALVPALVEELH